jgi:hypothetical protein
VHSATAAARRQQRGSCGGVGSAKAQRWRQLGGGEAVVEAQQRCGGGSVSGGGGGAQVAARWLRCAVEQIWVLWLHDLWWLEGGAAQVKGASTIAKNKSEKPHKQDGCTNLNWYSSPANSILHVYFDR